MPLIQPRDRVIEYSTSNSQTVFAVSGAIDSSCNPFSASMSVGDTVIGGVVEPGVAFKSGILTYSAANQVTVTTVSDSKGTFSASGTKQVFMGLPAAYAGKGLLTGVTATAGATRTAVAADHGIVIFRRNAGAAMLDTLPGTGPGVLPSGTVVSVSNIDASALYAISPGAGATLDGSATNFIMLGPGQTASVTSDGSNYSTVNAPKRAQAATNNAAVSIFVDPAGADTNSGISSAVPFQTIQAAMNFIFTRMDHGGGQLTLKLAAGTYAGVSIRGGLTGHFGNPLNTGITFRIVGDVANAAAYIIDGGAIPAVETVLGKSLHITGVTLKSTSSYGIRNYDTGGEVVPETVIFGACGAGHIYVGDGAVIRMGGGSSWTISGDAPFLVNADKGGIFECPSAGTITFSGARTFSNAVLYASTGGIISLDNITWALAGGASVAGQMWKREACGVIRPNANAVLDALFAGPTSGVSSDYIAAAAPSALQAATVTMSIASPAVVTFAVTNPYAGLTAGSTAPIRFTTTGALPTGVVAGTQYWVIGSSVAGATLKFATSIANALAGTAVNTSGTQSGTHTATPALPLTTATDTSIAAISVPAGDWEVDCVNYYAPAATTSITNYIASLSTSDAATDSHTGLFAQNLFAAIVTGGPVLTEKIPPARFSFSAPTTIYLIAYCTFTVSTLSAYGMLRARRAVT